MTNPPSTISMTQVAAMRAALDRLAPKPKTQFTSREAIAAMADDIRRARTELGYSLEDLATLLQPHGLAIRPNTLRGYLRGIEKEADAARDAAAARPRVRRTRTGNHTPAGSTAPGMPDDIMREEIRGATHDGPAVRPSRAEPPHG